MRYVELGYDNIVELLLRNPNVDPATNDNEAFIKAAESGITFK